MEVQITGNGANTTVDTQIDTSFQAMRVNLKPLEFTGLNGIGPIGGHFNMAAYFSNTAGQPNAALSQLFSMRWADSRMFFVLKRVAVCAAITTLFTTGPQLIDFDIIKATSFSTNPSGGQAITLATVAQKARSATMNNSLLALEGDIRISTGSAITAGTQTLDTQPFGYAQVVQQPANSGSVTAGSSQPTYVSLYEVRDFGQHPFVFGANEGFVIRNVTAFGAAGVCKIGIMMEWAEVPNF